MLCYRDGDTQGTGHAVEPGLHGVCGGQHGRSWWQCCWGCLLGPFEVTRWGSVGRWRASLFPALPGARDELASKHCEICWLAASIARRIWFWGCWCWAHLSGMLICFRSSVIGGAWSHLMTPLVAPPRRYSLFLTSVEHPIDGSYMASCSSMGASPLSIMVMSNGLSLMATILGYTQLIASVTLLFKAQILLTTWVLSSLESLSGSSLHVGLVGWVDVVPDNAVDSPFFRVRLFAVIFIVYGHVFLGHICSAGQVCESKMGRRSRQGLPCLVFLAPWGTRGHLNICGNIGGVFVWLLALGQSVASHCPGVLASPVSLLGDVHLMHNVLCLWHVLWL